MTGTILTPDEILRTVFGYSHFRSNQKQVIDTLLRGEDRLVTYTFNSGVAKHTFCRTCGIKPFYIPRSNPDGIDVNVNCLDPVPTAITIADFDGRHWEQHAHVLAHKSMDS